LFGLTAGAEERIVPGGGAAGAVASQATLLPLLAYARELLFLVLFLDALLGFQYEAGALVEVDSAVRLGAVRVVKDDPALEDVGVLVVVWYGRVRARDFEDAREFVEEGDVVGAFGSAGA
jgi:hypothetical protein